MSHTASQHWNSGTYAENARFVADYGASLLAWLNAKPAEKICDLGCGDGVLTAQIAATGADVLGVDGSHNLVTAARKLGVNAEVGNGEALRFTEAFDAVFSNAALHWMLDSDAVIRGVYRALKSGGRFVAEMGGQGNVAVIHQAIVEAAAHHGITAKTVWYFPDVETYRAQLENAGFRVEDISLYARPTPLATGVAGWLATFAAPLLQDADAATKAQIIQEACQVAERALPRNADGVVLADYRRLRFRARKA